MSEIEDVLKMREVFYGFLCRLYLEEPPRELAEDLADGKFPLPEGALLSLDEDLKEGFYRLKELGERYSDVDELHERMVDEYTRFFIGPHALPVQPYASSWIDGERFGRSLIEVKSRYNEAGIERARSYPEPEDHIAFELNFMHHLSTLACEDEENRAAYLRMQHEFLSEHLLAWVPKFSDKLYENPETELFKAIAKITKGFLLLDEVFLEGVASSVSSVIT
jgi:anaerobic sulfite reductase subunit A